MGLALGQEANQKNNVPQFQLDAEIRNARIKNECG